MDTSRENMRATFGTADLQFLIDIGGEETAAYVKLGERLKLIKQFVIENVKSGDAKNAVRFRASHSESDRETFPYKLICERMNVSKQMLVANRKITNVHTVKFTALV